jgi:probable HAF family extracellular repeat protein
MFKTLSLDRRKHANLEDTPMIRKTKSAPGPPQTNPEGGNMKPMKCMCITAITLFAVLAVPLYLKGQQAHKPQQYTVIDLGTLGGTFSLAGGLNKEGDVEGFSTLPGDTAVHAVLWRKGMMLDLGTLGGPNSLADYRPNERDQVGGQAETSTPDPTGENFCGNDLICLPFLWQKGVMFPLPTLGGNNGGANGVNSRGQVAGFAENTTIDPCGGPQEVRAVIWHRGAVQELPSDDPNAFANAINDKAQAVGQTGGRCTPPHAVLWENGAVTELGTLGGSGSFAVDINNQGQVVGNSDMPGDTTFHAFLWQNGVIADLSTLPGDVSSGVDGINNKGQAVGRSVDINGNSRAFLWQNGVMTDLNTLIPVGSPLFLLEASGTINSRGQLAGYALQISSGEIHAFLATPSDGQAGSQSATPAVQGVNRPALNVSLPDNVRKLLQHRRGKFGAGPIWRQ